MPWLHLWVLCLVGSVLVAVRDVIGATVGSCFLSSVFLEGMTLNNLRVERYSPKMALRFCDIVISTVGLDCTFLTWPCRSGVLLLLLLMETVVL